MLSHSLAYQMATSLAVAAFLAGCTGPDPQPGSSDSGQPDASITAPSAPNDSPTGDEVSRDDLIHEDVVKWEAYDVKKQEPIGTDSELADPDFKPAYSDGYEIIGDKQIRVFFLGGTSACHGYRVQVEEHPDRIAIAIISGYVRELGPNEACTAIGISRSFLIDLKDPVGDRAIVPLARPDSLKP